MSQCGAARLAWSLRALSVALAGLALALGALNWSTRMPEGEDPRGILFFAPLFLLLSTVGTLIASRRSGSPIGWIFCLAGLSGIAWAFAFEYAVYALLTEPGSLPQGVGLAWAANWLFVPALGPTLTLLFLLFPDGRLLSPRWRPVAWLAFAAMAVLIPGLALFPGSLEDTPIARNPFGIEGAEDVLNALKGVGFLLVIVSIPASVASLALRFHRARGVERQQLKWLAYTAALLAVSTAGGFIVGTLLGLSWAGKVAPVLFALALAGVPISTGIAIFRYRLYDIDLIIHKTLVYGVLSGSLAGLYFAIVLALQQAFSFFTEGNALAIAGSTLAVAALFRPARRRIQSVVDRRFYRRKYDAQQTLEAFSARLREEIDLEALSAELKAVVRETMQPAHVSVWLRMPEAER